MCTQRANWDTKKGLVLELLRTSKCKRKKKIGGTAWLGGWDPIRKDRGEGPGWVEDLNKRKKDLCGYRNGSIEEGEGYLITG